MTPARKFLDSAEAAPSFEQLVRSIVRDELAATRPATVDEYLSTSTAAKVADVSTGTIRRWVREQRLVGYRAGRELRFKRADIDRLMSTGRRRVANAELSPEARALRDVG